MLSIEPSLTGANSSLKVVCLFHLINVSYLTWTVYEVAYFDVNWLPAKQEVFNLLQLITVGQEIRFLTLHIWGIVPLHIETEK